MSSFTFNETRLERLITHKVGNKHNDQALRLSNELTVIDEETTEYLMAYFLQDFKQPEFFSFGNAQDSDMNDVYPLIKQIFEDKETFVESSKQIAKRLYLTSDHPNIKDGDLNIAYMNELLLEGEILDGIGIFKSENISPFLKMKSKRTGYSIAHDFGVEVKKIDKACVIFNTNEEHGFIVMIIDNINRANDARYWKDDFLRLSPVNDAYYNTKEFLSMTKDFVSNQLSQEFEIENADRIDLLNRSIDYFKSNEAFDKNDFEESVFQDEKLIESFREFDKNYRDEFDIDPADRFDISDHAVKKQSRIFKSVLKLDKNFHVYIHGDRSKIEKGIEKDGRKFYKIYYDNET
jgi:hypothetical protein